VRTVVNSWSELLEPLLVGLSSDEQLALLGRLDEARDEQLDRKLHPRPRRRRDERGALVWPETRFVSDEATDVPQGSGSGSSRRSG
jgi:hypothetical protein